MALLRGDDTVVRVRVADNVDQRQVFWTGLGPGGVGQKKKMQKKDTGTEKEKKN